MSRLPGKRARPVLRGLRRGDAPELPDWKPFYYLLDDALEMMLVNASRVRNVPGRKTDLLTELPRGLRGGCVPRGVRLARFAARDGRWRTAAGFGGAGGAGSGCFGGHRRSLPALSAG